MVLFVVVEVAVVAVVCFFIGVDQPRDAAGAGAAGATCGASGSGNPGATNAGRVLGRKWGALVLVLDVLKAYLPTLVVLRTMGTVPALVAGFAVVLGHVFSPFLRGRGGKGWRVPRHRAGRRALGGARGARGVRAREDRRAVRGGGLGGHDGAGRPGGLLAAFGWVPLVEPVVGVWLIALAVLVLWRHRRNILAWWKRGCA